MIHWIQLVLGQTLRNFEWMRTVTKEEAQESRERLERWAASTTAPSGGVIGEWIFDVRNSAERPEEPVSDVASLTPNAVQRNWRTPAKFEQCPDACSLDALTEYAVRLSEGTVFAHYAYGPSVIVTAQQIRPQSRPRSGSVSTVRGPPSGGASPVTVGCGAQPGYTA